MPYYTNGSFGLVGVDMWNNFMVLESTFGLRIMIDGQHRLFLQVDDRYKYELCGLCGTYSGYQDDDFVTPGGQNASGPFEFGDSWRLPDSDGYCLLFGFIFNQHNLHTLGTSKENPKSLCTGFYSWFRPKTSAFVWCAFHISPC